MSRTKHTVAVIGGGAAGIAAAASLLKRRPGLDIAIVEPCDTHAYQPGWTMVGGGVFDVADTIRPMASVMPRGVTWVKQACSSFQPDNNQVTLSDGSTLAYDVLIVAPGIRLAWEKISGLDATLGQNGVTSNYRPDLAPYTWELVQRTRAGRAIFTQPPLPIKCAGGPQKAMYLACDHWLRAGVLGDIAVEFRNAGGVLFGVADYVPALMEYVGKYGIRLELGSNLVAVDGPARQATFATAHGEETVEFDMLHAVPPPGCAAVSGRQPVGSAKRLCRSRSAHAPACALPQCLRAWRCRVYAQRQDRCCRAQAGAGDRGQCAAAA